MCLQMFHCFQEKLGTESTRNSSLKGLQWFASLSSLLLAVAPHPLVASSSLVLTKDPALPLASRLRS